jgi:hypothetical protein
MVRRQIGSERSNFTFLGPHEMGEENTPTSVLPRRASIGLDCSNLARSLPHIAVTISRDTDHTTFDEADDFDSECVPSSEDMRKAARRADMPGKKKRAMRNDFPILPGKSFLRQPNVLFEAIGIFDDNAPVEHGTRSALRPR